MKRIRAKTRFTELKRCPFCGHNRYYGTKRNSGKDGIMTYITTFERGIEGAKIYCNEKEGSNGRAYCEKCHAFLGNVFDNIVSKPVDDVIFGRTKEKAPISA